MRDTSREFVTRWRRRQDEMRAEREAGRRRAARFDRYLGWIFSLAFVLLLVLIATGAAAARWLWLACTA